MKEILLKNRPFGQHLKKHHITPIEIKEILLKNRPFGQHLKKHHITPIKMKEILLKNRPFGQHLEKKRKKHITPIKLKEILFSDYHARSFWNYNQTYIKRSPLGQRKSVPIRQVIS